MTSLPPDCPRVVVRRDPDAYACARGAIDALVLPDVSDAAVLVKPNAGRKVAFGTGVTTNPVVVAAVCDALREKGARLTIGESTIVGVTPPECLDATGIADVAREREIPLANLDTPKPDVRPITDGRILSSLTVCGGLGAYDRIVSVPVMKTHMHCRVTLSLKNMKGCLRGREKVRLHQLPRPDTPSPHKTLDMAIADLATVLAPDIAVIDGTIGHEGLGPSGGSPKRFDTVVASTAFLSADAVAATLMGFDPADIPHLALAAENGAGCIECDKISVDPPDWREWTDPFDPPPEKLEIEFPDLTVLDSESCSACVSTLLLFLTRYYAQLGDYLPLTVAIGKGHDEVPDGTLCIGNCTACAKKSDSCLSVKGCPPVASAILAALEEESARRE